jgi:hypothetical protein
MLNDRHSILTIEVDGETLAEATVFGMADALAQAKKLKEDYGFDPDAPVCFIYIESKMNYDTVYQQAD